jgi:uncharacterized membrane protein YgcG
MANRLPTTRKPILAEVVQVAENATQLDPVTEIAEIQRMCNSHNAKILDGTAPPGATPYQIKKTVFYTGYMIPPSVTEKLVSLVKLPQGMPEGDIKYLANSILITPKPLPKSISDKVGGIGAKVMWKVTGISVFENKLWAARVEPVPKNTQIYSENRTPTVVLAIRKGGRPADATRIHNWHPVPDEQAFMFESVVGEKVMLRIEEERPGENQWESVFPNRNHPKRPRSQDLDGHAGHHKDFRTHHTKGHGNGPSNHRGGNRGRGGNRNFAASRGRGGGAYNRGGGGSGGGNGSHRGRGRGGPAQYRSRDDISDSYGQPNYGDDPNSYY